MREVFGRPCSAVVNDLRLRPLLAGASVGLVAQAALAQPPATERNGRPTDEIVVTASAT